MLGVGALYRNNSVRYDEIPDTNGEFHRNFWDARYFFRTWSMMKVLMLGMVILLVGIIIVQGVHERDVELEYELEIQQQQGEYYNPEGLPMPAGVNLGSWLSLEDYFFAGLHNSVEVATPGQLQDADKIAACLPPLHVGSTTGPKWQSETDLFQNLMDPNITQGGSVKHAIEVFAAHRASFVDLEEDLQRLAALGITTVRVPMSWCWTDKDPRKTNLGSESDEDLLQDFACRDPFYENILWPAIPKPLIEDLLRACATAGLKASLDVHTYPGGTSIGTFSGVWPNWPRFWTHGGDGVGTDLTNTTGFGIGHKLFRELVEWMEDLSDRDPHAFSGLRGLSPMNEPAHLAGNSEDDDPTNFLPRLPKELEDDFLEFLNSHIADGDDYTYPVGTHLRVFYWFQGAIEIFRQSKLPSLGKEVQVNIHESVFHWLANWWETWRVDAELRGKAIATWWCAQSSDTTNKFPSTTSSQERSDWAVMDMHHYHAWSDVCSGTIDGQDAAYACGDSQTRSAVLDQCVVWVQEFRDIFDGVCGTSKGGKPLKLMSAEFSAASHHSVRRSCSDTSGLRESYSKQVEAGDMANVELFYWSYKMPYGGSFKGAGWSFSEIMYKFGVFARPDAPQFDCDAHLYEDPEVP